VGRGSGLKISREELYRRVWESPVTHLAKEFDISDVGLAKACRKNAIPLPPVGYWAKLKHGKAGRQPPLPKLETVSEIEIDARRFRVPTVKKTPTEKAVPLPVVVPEPDVLPEKLGRFTAATRKKLLGMKPDKYGFVFSLAPDLFDCRLSQGAVEAATHLLDAIEKALPHVDAKLVKGEKSLEVEYAGQRVPLRLLEQYARVQVKTPHKSLTDWMTTDYVYTFTGKFTFEVTGYFNGRKKWADGSKTLLSAKLGEVVQGLVDAALAIKQREEELAAQRLIWAEEEKVRQERERELRDIEDFRQKLLAEARAAKEHDVMQEYLLDIQRELDASGASLEQPARDWLARANSILAQNNPQLRRIKRLLDGVPVEPYYGSFGKTLG
jgi:hypothetical protein